MFSVRVPLEVTDAACAIRLFVGVGDTRKAAAPRLFRFATLRGPRDRLARNRDNDKL
jgi:hypothetical protein